MVVAVGATVQPGLAETAQAMGWMTNPQTITIGTVRAWCPTPYESVLAVGIGMGATPSPLTSLSRELNNRIPSPVHAILFSQKTEISCCTIRLKAAHYLG